MRARSELQLSRGIEQAFAEIGLPPPEISARWASGLREREPWLFCTGAPPRTALSDFEDFVEDALDGSIENGLLIGRQGYGVNNWALHYYLIEEDLLVLLERRWGNVYDDEDQRRHELLTAFASLADLLAEVRRVRAAEIKLPGRLTVVDGVRGKPRWNYTGFPSAGSDGADAMPSFLLDWNTSGDVLAAAADDLKGR